MTILLNSEEIKKCVELNEQLIPIIENAFKNLALGKTTMPPILRLDIEKYHGESDVKAAYIDGLDSYAIKIASGFFNNPKLGLPSSNGLVLNSVPVVGEVSIGNGGGLSTGFYSNSVS